AAAVVAGAVLFLGGGGGVTTTVGAIDVVIEQRLVAVGTFQSGEITTDSELTTRGRITDPKTGAIEGETTGRLIKDRENGEDETEDFGPEPTKEGAHIDPETGQFILCVCPTYPDPPENRDVARQIGAVGDAADGIPKRATTEGEHEIGKDPDAPEPTTDLILTGMDDRAEPRIIENSGVVETTVVEEETGAEESPLKDIAGGALIVGGLGLGALAGRDGLRTRRSNASVSPPEPSGSGPSPSETAPSEPSGPEPRSQKPKTLSKKAAPKPTRATKKAGNTAKKAASTAKKAAKATRKRS
ncbi:MAG TPA: hypothetical protein VMQ81_04240, partial [Acidimicrobiia bacterium]|nr:hypothetical protein [Acidimicrobiia bacterium]